MPVLQIRPDGRESLMDVGPTNPLPISIQGRPIIEVTSTMVIRKVAFTRPANTTAYAIGDEVSNSATATSVVPLKFENVTRSPLWTATILDAMLVDDTNEATLPALELWLFTSPPTTAGDNVTCAFSDADLVDRLVHVIPFYVSYAGILSTGGNTVFSAPGINQSFYAPGGNLFGIYLARNAYTPLASEIFTTKLRFLVD